MQSMDLGWLQFVGYALVAATIVSYAATRIDVRRLSKGWKGALTGVLAFLAASAFSVREHHAQAYSPRVKLSGVVARLNEDPQGKGGYADEFVLALPDGRYSPLLETDRLGSRSSNFRPLAKGDTLQIEYRTWDETILSIDVIDGIHPGWSLRYQSDAYSELIGGCFLLLGGFAYFVWQWNQDRQGNEVVTVDTKPMPSDIVTLGLSDESHT
ncbi:hypothetical protein SAMN05421819_1511 [Bryocella elongata]|uniref:Uncharacterized protein n=1 Tax=Bryocella elongata TaxID=863522 RepID=A0A1H5WC23_9BACT|nr:hypothetical protein [Bryocella elongata]SEF96908.1 hypothetical protein SAMN05421819_1511 [Bryocella elongata]